MSMPLSDYPRAAAAAAGLHMRSIMGRDQRREAVIARQCAYQVAYENGYSIRQIATVFKRDRATVLYGLRKRGVR